MGQRAPQQLFFYYNKLQFKNLTSNQVVGSSNLSGRASHSQFGRIILAPIVGECYYASMRVIAKSRLRRFWDSSPKYIDAKKQMTEWYNFCASAKSNTPHKLKADLRNASVLKNNRVVFKICGNKYRIVVLMDYARHGMLIRFVGTHEEYDKIGDIEHI